MKPRLALSVASLATFLVAIDGTVLFAAFQRLVQSFPGEPPTLVAWVLNAYTITVASLLIVSGRLGDWIGQERVFRIGLSLFLVASYACGNSAHLSELIAARVLQGMGAAMLTPSSLALILGNHRDAQKPMAIAIWGATGGLAAALGPGLGSVVVDHLGWHWAFYLNLPLGAIAVLAASFLGGPPLTTRLRLRHGIDVLSAVLLGGALACLTWTLLSARSIDAVHLGIGMLLTIALGGWFVYRSRQVPQALVPAVLWRVPGYMAATGASICFSTGFAMLFFGFFFLVTNVWKLDLSHAGLAITPGPLTVIPVTVASGRLAIRWGHRPLIIAGSLLLGLSALWLMHYPTYPQYATFLLPGLLISGVGIGLVMSSLTAVATMKLPAHMHGIGAAVNQTVRQIGSVLGVTLTVALMTQGATGYDPYVLLYATLTLLSMATAACVWRWRAGPAAHTLG